jgi:hypothetical protein
MNNSNKLITALGLSFLAACGDLRTSQTSLNIQGTFSSANNLFSAFEIDPAFNLLTATDLTITNPNGSTAGTLTLTSAKIVLKAIRFQNLLAAEDDSASDDDSEDTIEFEGPFIVDLLTNTTTPSIADLQVPVGSYKRIRMEMHKLDPEDESTEITSSNPMMGYSLWIEGTYTGQVSTSSATNMPFLLTNDMDEEFDLESEREGFEIGSSSVSENVMIAFRLNEWLKLNDTETNPESLSFSNVVPNSGSIELTKHSNQISQKFLEIVKKNLKESADFGKDSDDDGKLEDNEDQADDAGDDSNS